MRASRAYYPCGGRSPRPTGAIWLGVRSRDAFLAAGEAALTTKPATGEELESDRLKARLGAALIERDLLNEKIAILEANRPLARRRLKP